MIKQVIVMRTDLNMRKGKMVAQGAHASMAAILINSEEIVRNGNDYKVILLNDPLRAWLNGSFTKICVGCSGEDELLNLHFMALDSGISNVSLIEDNGVTEFNGVPTKTCIAIGPDESEKIDRITGHLKLL